MKRHPWVEGLCTAVCSLALAAIIAGMAAQDLWAYRRNVRGVETGLEAKAPRVEEPRLGTNVSLEQYPSEVALREALRQARSLGIGTLRQRLPWAEVEPERGAYRWEVWDRLLPAMAEAGFRVILVLDTSPAWARPPWEVNNPLAPPADLADYARFAGAVAARYGRYVLAYQVWDEPNIYPHWGQGEISPASYVEMLRLASETIHQNDPEAFIIAGGLAPNLEAGGRNMSDVQFLREMYRRGAGAYFDVLGVKAYGFWSGPYDRRVSEKVLNFSRLILLREEMVRRGEGHKSIWALEGGWCALERDWQGVPSPTGSDIPVVQAERLKQALQRVQREWPWMGLVAFGHLQPNAPPHDPLWGYALLDAQGRPTALYRALQEVAREPPTAYPGRWQGASTLWAHTASGAAELRFWGTDVRLSLGNHQKSLVFTSDALPNQIAVSPGENPSPKTLRWHAEGGPTVHHLLVQGEGRPWEFIETLTVGARRPLGDLWLKGVVALAACLWLTLLAWRAGRLAPWRVAWAWCQRHWEGLPMGWRWMASLVPLAGLIVAPSTPWRVGMLALYGLVALLQPQVALLGAVVAIPFAPLNVHFGRWAFSISEIALWVAVGARVWEGLFRPREVRLSRPVHLSWSRVRWLDLAVGLFVLLGLVATVAAEYQRVAWREWRLIVLEPALLYGLLRLGGHKKVAPLAVIDALWIGAVATALYALAIYPLPSGVIEAEGVRRAHGFYGSPNNLALYLERILPLGVAFGLWGQKTWRRWAYGLGAIPIAAALILTFSRGAWALGLPAAALTLALLGSRPAHRKWVALAALGLGGILVLGAWRLRGALDWRQGTAFLRLSLWQSAWEMARDHPWVGVGPDNFLYYYGDYIRPGAEVDRWLSHPHNVVLDFWLRLGIGGVAILAAFVGGVVARLRAWLTNSPHREARLAALGLAAGMAAGLAHGMMDSAYFTGELAGWFMVALAWVNGLS